jgi:carbamoyl-phosphate synthase small subunit
LKVAAIDLGIKGATPKAMAQLGIQVHVLPMSTTYDEIKQIAPDGIFLSNGPGDPAAMTQVIELVRQVLSDEVPLFGICFGHQILGRALGFETYKLPFGHRGINQPVIDLTTGKVEITAHNHGFAVAAPKEHVFKTVYGEGRVTHISLNDSVVEGLELISLPAFSVQYHPESAAGPHDASYLFKRFVNLMQNKKMGSEELHA